MLKKFKNTLGGIQTIQWIGGTIMLPLITFTTSLYQKIGLAPSITLTAVTFAAGVWLIIGLNKLYQLLFRPTEPISLLDLLKKAQKNGWNFFSNQEPFQILDFEYALRASAKNKEIIISGKKNNINALPDNIPNTYWDIHHLNCTDLLMYENSKRVGFKNSNHTSIAYRPGTVGNEYKDLFIETKDIDKWIKSARRKHLG